ncbi:unnamed protein product [Linum tenue]|uniref:Uncharacterized protein n=1 Tax=Linum tenue TaxID=586396 RepID=A0AAV0HH82_9ROSI|nr:unnamed protein product [Linum tenue]
MFRTLARLRRNIKKSPRVADESMFGGGGVVMMNRAGGGGDHRQQDPTDHSSNKLSAVMGLVLLAPFSPHVSGADGMWASAELPQLSEVNHLMVNDSMRYAILM